MTSDTNTTRAFAVDRAVTTLRVDSSDGFTWNEAQVVRIDNVPHEAAFDTEQFYKIPLTAAKPIEQDYETTNGDTVTMMKPADELRDAAWSLDNAPITLGHPNTRIVDSVDLVNGFVRNPRWDASEEALEADAYIPVDNDEAKEWISDNDGVSIGFWYETDRDTDDTSVDGYQRDLLVDHVAIVAEGRCSREDGCGLAADAANAVRGFLADTDGPCSRGPCSCGLHVDKTEAREARNEYRYSTKEAARKAAEELNCADGEGDEIIHSHENKDGETVYMPCEAHDTFRKAFTRERGDEFEHDDISDSQTSAIETIRDEHDEMDTSEISPNLSTLKAVYRRGAAAWEDSHAGNATQQQWALARVKEFLKDMRNGNSLNSGADNDLAPDEYSPPSGDQEPQGDSLTTDAKSVDEIDMSPPDKIVNAVEAGMEAKEKYSDQIGDCGTGVGESMGKKIINDNLTPDILATGGDVASNSPATYLDSHEGDVEPDGPPTSWGEDEWTGGCGEVQQALWGYYKDWFKRKAEHVEDIRDDSTEHGSDAVATDRPTEDRHWTDYGKVSIDHQTGSNGVTIDMAAAPADFYVALHDDGDEYVRQNVSAGEQLGRTGPLEAYDDHDRLSLSLDEPISEARTVYAVLYYADETGDMGNPIESQRGFIFDSAVLMPSDSRNRSMRKSIFGNDARTVAGVTFDGVSDGDLDESDIPSDDYKDHYLYPGDTKSESSYPVVDADGMLRTGNISAAYSLGARGGIDADNHDSKLKELNDVACDSNVGCAVEPQKFDADNTFTLMSDDTQAAFDVADLTLDAIAEKHDAVGDLISEREEYKAQLDGAKDTIEQLREELDEYRQQERDALVDEITSLISTWDEDDLRELEMDALEARHELAKDAATDVNGSGAGSAVETDGADNESTESEYETGEVFDLANTA